MDVVNDISLLLLNCMAMFNHNELSNFMGFLFGGIFLGASCWILCSRYAHLWNLRYHVTVSHHVLCGIAAALTILFTLAFACLKYTKQAAEIIISGWQLQILSDSAWEKEAFRKTYEEIKGLGVENFTSFPHPSQGGNLVPLNKMESRRTLATVYSNEAVKHFNKSHPYLSKILMAEPGISPEMITEDVNTFFATHSHEIYSNLNAVRLAANHIRQNLDLQAPRVVPISRTIIVILFLLVQAIPFGLIGVAAYRDLKVIT